MIDRLIYTYWTNHGDNYLMGFHTEDSFLDIAMKSLEQSKKYFKEVVIYTDTEGKVFLDKYKFDCEIIVIDYDNYQWNKQYWNFPKLISYNLQEVPFLHIDFDVILHEKPKNLDAKILTEKIRPLLLVKKQMKFLPQDVLDNYSPNNICSGIIGGNPEIFKILYRISSILVMNTASVNSIMLFAIEEIVLTSICKKKEMIPQPIDCEFTHYQSGAEKMKLLTKNLKI